MRKTILFLAVLALAWIAYLAWPAYDLFQFVRAIERGDANTAVHYVNMPRVRMSLTEQITEAYLQRTGARSGPLGHSAVVGALADPIVYKLITPEAFTELLRIGWPRAVLPESPSNTTGISIASLGTAWQLFAAAEYGVGRYEVTVPVGVSPERAFVLQFRLAQWRWQLAAVRMPESIRLLLADEVIKSAKALQPAPRP
jgi:hypothetical protein